MPLRINLADKDKTWKMELESELFIGKKMGENVIGKEISDDLEGYEFQISGASDIAGFPHKKDVEGPQLRKVLLSKGWGMHNNKKGIRLKKSVRGNVLSEKTVQINLTIIKKGSKELNNIFPEQNKAPEPEKKEETKVEALTESSAQETTIIQ